MPNATTNQIEQLMLEIQMLKSTLIAQHNEIEALREAQENLNRYTDDLNEDINSLKGMCWQDAEAIENLDARVEELECKSADLDERMDVCERDSENAVEAADENRADLSDCENRLCDLEGNVQYIEEWKDEHDTAEDIEELSEFIKGQFNRLGRWMQSVDARLGGE